MLQTALTHTTFVFRLLVWTAALAGNARMPARSSAPDGSICPVLRRRMWMLLQVHAKQCQRSDCPVPRCKELREMRRRAVVRQEDQRRVAYKNMVCMRRPASIIYVRGVVLL